MRKKISVIMFVVLLIRIFTLSAVAADSDQTFSKDFSTEQRDTVNRYGMDIVYQNFSIPVQQAVWNVNTYHYEVTMGFDIPEGYEDNADFAPFSLSVKVINHSDMPIFSTIESSLNNGMMLGMTQISSVQNGDPSNIRTIYGTRAQIDAVVEGAAYESYFHESQIIITPTNGWESFINSLIANGATDGSFCTIGTVNIVIEKD